MKFVVAVLVYILGTLETMSEKESCVVPAVCEKPGLTSAVWVDAPSPCKSHWSSPGIDDAEGGTHNKTMMEAMGKRMDSRLAELQNATDSKVEGRTARMATEFLAQMDEKLAEWKNETESKIENMTAHLAEEFEVKMEKKLAELKNSTDSEVADFLARHASEFEAKVDEKLVKWKNDSANETAAAIIRHTNEFEPKIQENFTKLQTSTTEKIDQMLSNITGEENAMEKQIEVKFDGWRELANRDVEEMKNGVQSKMDEWQGLKDELAEQNSTIYSELDGMRINFYNTTNELDQGVLKNFTKWSNSAESEVNETKADLINNGKDFEVSLQEKFTTWKTSADSKLNVLEIDLAKKDEEIAILKKNQWFIDCKDASSAIEGDGGVVKILPNYEVYCDMVTDGGNWIVFQRRVDGSVNFSRTWKEYATGFGNKQGEFWLGLEAIHQISKDDKYELRVDLTNWNGETAYAKYRTFSIGGRSDDYRLSIGGYSGTAGDAMNNHNNGKFSAKNKDVDTSARHCASIVEGGWWFRDCEHSSLNGKYNDTSGNWTGVFWYNWGNRNHYSLKGSEMKFRKK